MTKGHEHDSRGRSSGFPWIGVAQCMAFKPGRKLGWASDLMGCTVFVEERTRRVLEAGIQFDISSSSKPPLVK